MPSPLFTRCSKRVELAWILRVSGDEGIIEFCLARAEMTSCRYEKEKWMKYVRCAAHQRFRITEMERKLASQAPPSMTWEERRQVLIQRDQQRRNGSLERSWAKPSPSRVEERQLQLW